MSRESCVFLNNYLEKYNMQCQGEIYFLTISFSVSQQVVSIATVIRVVTQCLSRQEHEVSVKQWHEYFKYSATDTQTHSVSSPPLSLFQAFSKVSWSAALKTARQK